MNNLKTNKAFTLIEVLVVTAVISLVASIVNAQMSEARQKADDAHMKTEVQQVRTAVEQYRQKEGKVPYVASGYTAGNMVREDDPKYKELMNKLVEEGFMPEIPTSPNGQSYSYLATADGERAVFAAALNSEDSGGNTNSCEVVDSITYMADLDQDGNEDQDDVDLFNSSYNSVEGDENYIQRADYNNDSVIGTYDYGVFNDYYGNYVVDESSPGYGLVCSGTSNSDYCSCI